MLDKGFLHSKAGAALTAVLGFIVSVTLAYLYRVYTEHAKIELDETLERLLLVVMLIPFGAGMAHFIETFGFFGKRDRDN